MPFSQWNNTASNGGIIATNGSNLENVGNVVNNYNMQTTQENQIELSKQAMKILVEFFNSNVPALNFLCMTTRQRIIRQLNLQEKQIDIDDKTIDADMNALVEGGYLKIIDPYSTNSRKYELTYKGREFAANLLKSNTELI